MLVVLALDLDLAGVRFTTFFLDLDLEEDFLELAFFPFCALRAMCWASCCTGVLEVLTAAKNASLWADTE